MANKIVLVERQNMTEEEHNLMAHSTLDLLVEKFKVVSGTFEKNVYLAFHKENEIVFLNIKSGIFEKLSAKDFKPKAPSVFNDLLIKEESYYYFTSEYGQAYRIAYSCFLNEILGIKKQIDEMDGISEDINLNEQEFLRSEEFYDLLYQNLGEHLYDHIEKAELIADCDYQNLLMRSLLKASFRDFGSSVYTNLGLKED